MSMLKILWYAEKMQSIHDANWELKMPMIVNFSTAIYGQTYVQHSLYTFSHKNTHIWNFKTQTIQNFFSFTQKSQFTPILM